MPFRDPRRHLEDVLDAINKIDEFIGAIDLNAYRADDKTDRSKRVSWHGEYTSAFIPSCGRRHRLGYGERRSSGSSCNRAKAPASPAGRITRTQLTPGSWVASLHRVVPMDEGCVFPFMITDKFRARIRSDLQSPTGRTEIAKSGSRTSNWITYR